MRKTKDNQCTCLPQKIFSEKHSPTTQIIKLKQLIAKI